MSKKKTEKMSFCKFFKKFPDNDKIMRLLCYSRDSDYHLGA